MQVFCFLVGSLAFFSVRKQKVVSLSLFDQRRMASGKRRPGDTGAFELVTKQQQEQQETMPLTNTLDVV
jgi:hypothetical protein